MFLNNVKEFKDVWTRGQIALQYLPVVQSEITKASKKLQKCQMSEAVSGEGVQNAEGLRQLNNNYDNLCVHRQRLQTELENSKKPPNTHNVRLSEIPNVLQQIEKVFSTYYKK